MTIWICDMAMLAEGTLRALPSAAGSAVVACAANELLALCPSPSAVRVTDASRDCTLVVAGRSLAVSGTLVALVSLTLRASTSSGGAPRLMLDVAFSWYETAKSDVVCSARRTVPVSEETVHPGAPSHI